jgi:hypothetical protein
MTRYLRFLFPILSILLMGIAFFQFGSNFLTMGLILWGAFWIIGLGFNWKWVPTLGLFLTFGASVLFIYMNPMSGNQANSVISFSDLVRGGSPNWQLILLYLAALFSYLSWDMADFYFRMRQASLEDNITKIENRHLDRLAIVTFLGVILSVVTLLVHIKLSFEWMVVLLLFAVWGIGRAVNWLLKKSS